MSGLFDFKPFLLLLVSLFLCLGWAEETPTPTPSPFVRGKIKVNSATVYKMNDFDSPVLGHLAAGKVYDVFPKPMGAFYRIKIGQVTGFIADHEIQILRSGVQPAATPAPVTSKAEKRAETTKEKKSSEAVIKRKRAFTSARFLGISYSSNSYKEEKKKKKRSEAAPYFGIKMSGSDVMVEGDSSTEINIQIHSGAPSYYEKQTGVSSSGLIYLMDFQFLTVTSLNPVVLSWIGFGPLLRYAKFELGLRDQTTNKVTGYNAEDIALGAVFSLGLGFRMGSFALRPEFKYYWEKEQYLGAGAAFQFEF